MHCGMGIGHGLPGPARLVDELDIARWWRQDASVWVKEVIFLLFGLQ